MKINILHPVESRSFDFTIEVVLQNDTETIVIGYNHENNQLAPLGVIINQEQEQVRFYSIKQEAQKLYKKIIESESGKEFDLESDVSTGFWTSEKFTKVDSGKLIGMLKYYNEKPYRTITKTPNFFLVYDIKTGLYQKYSPIK